MASAVSVIITSCWDICNRLLTGLPVSCLWCSNLNFSCPWRSFSTRADAAQSPPLGVSPQVPSLPTAAFTQVWPRGPAEELGMRTRQAPRSVAALKAEPDTRTWLQVRCSQEGVGGGRQGWRKPTRFLSWSLLWATGATALGLRGTHRRFQGSSQGGGGGFIH